MDRSYHCGVLGVSLYATHEEIKSAYRSLVKKHHPDVDKTDPLGEKLKKFSASYAWLLKDVPPKPKYDPYANTTTIRIYRTLERGLYHSINIPFYSPLIQDVVVFCMWGDKEFQIVLKSGETLPKRVEMSNGKTKLTIEVYPEGNRHL